MPESAHYKIPESVLVIIHTAALDVLLMRRANMDETFWQSVTGSRKTWHEPLRQTAVREVFEETGLDALAPGVVLSDWHVQQEFEISPAWRGRFAPGVTHNLEHVFGLRLPTQIAVRLNPREHLDSMWLPWSQAAERCWSWTNARACRQLPQMSSGAVA